MNTQIENLLITAGLRALQTFFIVVGLGAIQFLVSILIKTRIEDSIRGDYARFLEKFKYDLRVREQAAKVAELFAETQLHWGDSKLTPEKARKINRLAWELSVAPG
jgi:hypothetical protein